MLKNKKGFTLLEIIVTVAVLAALATMLVPSFIHAQNDSRRNQDETKFQSVCTAFKTSLAEPEVIKEVEKLCDNNKLTITFEITDDGLLAFGNGEIVGNLDKKRVEGSTLWLNTYQTVGLTYDLASNDFKGKSLVLDITAKTEHTTAKCEFRIVD